MRTLAGLALLAVAACDAGLPPSEAPCRVGDPVGSRLVACVTGDVNVEVASTVSQSGWGDAGVPYDLWAMRTYGSAEGGVDLFVFLPNGTSIREGTYPIQAVALTPGPFGPRPADAEAGSAAATVYTPGSGGGIETWSVTSGEITVEAVTSEYSRGRRAGRFDLVGVEGDRRIRVEGRFQYVY